MGLLISGLTVAVGVLVLLVALNGAMVGPVGGFSVGDGVASAVVGAGTGSPHIKLDSGADFMLVVVVVEGLFITGLAVVTAAGLVLLGEVSDAELGLLEDSVDAVEVGDVGD
jgi:hypothetical protein